MPRSQAASIIERQQISAEADRIEALLEPCYDDLAIEAVVSQFLIGFELGNGRSDLNTEALNARYVKALRGLPFGAIETAIDRFDNVEGAKPLCPWDPKFRPNHVEFAREVRAGLVPLRRRLVHIRAILEAEPFDPPRLADGTIGTEDEKEAELLAEAFENIKHLGLRPKNEVLIDEARAERRARAQADLEETAERSREIIAELAALTRAAGTHPGPTA